MPKAPARRRKKSNWKVYVCLLVCFPYGLFLMWRTTSWRPAVKGLVTACFAALTLAVVLPLTSPPERTPGGVQLVGAQRDVEVFGPELPEALGASYAQLSLISSGEGPLLTQTQSPQTQTYVYSSRSDLYYHLRSCPSAQRTLDQQMTLAVAYYSGYEPCPVCQPETYTR